MKTKDRNIIQITLVFLGLLLILLTYFLYPKVKERKFIEEIKEYSLLMMEKQMDRNNFLLFF